MKIIPYNSDLIKYARELRKNFTPQEKKMWAYLKKRQVHGVKFLRQKIIQSYIVDFYAPEINLVIEIDGSQHFDRSGLYKDQQRDLLLKKLSIKVLRYNNADVNVRFNSVMEHLHQQVSLLM